MNFIMIHFLYIFHLCELLVKIRLRVVLLDLGTGENLTDVT